MISHDSHLGIHISLHLIIIPVEMVRCDIQNHSNVGLKVIHTLQLKTAHLQHIVVIMFCCNLPRKAGTHIAGQSHVQSCRFQYMIKKRNSSSLSVATRHTNQFCIRISACKLNFRHNRNTLCVYLLHHRRIVWYSRTLHNLLCRQYDIFVVPTLFKLNLLKHQLIAMLIF